MQKGLRTSMAFEASLREGRPTTGLMWDLRLVLVRSLAAVFWINCKRFKED